MQLRQSLYVFPLLVSLGLFTPLKATTAVNKVALDSFHFITGKKPLQDTTVTIAVAKGMSYRELARQAIAAANTHLPPEQQRQLSEGLYADNRGDQRLFPQEQQWVNTLSEKLATKKVLSKLTAGDFVSISVSKAMRIDPFTLTTPSSHRPPVPPPPLPELPEATSIPPWTGGSDAAFAKWITNFAKQFLPKSDKEVGAWKRSQMVHIAPEVVISTTKALAVTEPQDQQALAKTLITQALQPNVGNPSWWNAVKAAYLEKHPDQTGAATLFF